MAAETVVSEDIVKKMVTATKEHDGMTATRLLEEVGSCGWRDLIKQTNKTFDGWDARVRLGNESAVDHANASYESLTLYRSSAYWSGPLARVQDVRCEKK